MNIFGFPGIPGQPPNLGLLDQRLAIEWIHQNIESFGGDPDRIVISGQSCGSASVNYWPYAYKDKPLVAGLISHSGTVFSFPVNSASLSAQHWHGVSSLLGCRTSDDVLQCMKAQNVSALLEAAGKVKPPPGSSPARTPPAFQPTVDNVTTFGNYQELSDAGQFAHLVRILTRTMSVSDRNSHT